MKYILIIISFLFSSCDQERLSLNSEKDITSKETLFTQKDTVLVDQNASITFNVLDNDSSSEGILSLSSVTDGAKGLASIVDLSSGTVSYIPAAGLYGFDTISYTVTNGLEEKVVQVDIYIITDYTWNGSNSSLFSDVHNWKTSVPTVNYTHAIFNGSCIINCNVALDSAGLWNGIHIEKSFSGQLNQLDGVDLSFGYSGVLMEGGIFNGSSSSKITFRQKGLTINGGVFNAPSLMEVVTNLNLLSGEFNHNNGKVRANYRWGDWVVETPLKLYDFERESVYFADAQNITGASREITIDNNLKIINSAIDGAILKVHGNISIDVGSKASNSSLEFTGIKDQSFINIAGKNPSGQIIINKDGGIITLLSDLIFTGASQSLDFTKGTLDLNGFNLTIPGDLDLKSDANIIDSVGTSSCSVGSLNNLGGTDSVGCI